MNSNDILNVCVINDFKRLWELCKVNFLDAVYKGITESDMRFVQNLHFRIFKPKILHRQFHLIETVIVIKTQKISENAEIYTAGKNFTLPLTVTAWTNLTSELNFIQT